MSRRIAPRLPKELLDKLGATNLRKRNVFPLGKNHKNKNARQDIKYNQSHHKGRKHMINQSDEDNDDGFDDDELEASKNDNSSSELSKHEYTTKKIKLQPASKNYKPEGVRPYVSKAVKEQLAEDDADIFQLEKKLGIKKGGRSKAIEKDGFADLLTGIDDAMGLDSDEDNEEDHEWLNNKRNQAIDHLDLPSNIECDEADLDKTELDDFEANGSEEFEDNTEEDRISYSDEDEIMDSEEKQDITRMRVRENPYKPPVEGPTVKYIPPSLRKPSTNDEEALMVIRRQIQGLLNRLSEANLLSIVKELENVFSKYARQYVIKSLIDLLMGLLCDRSILADTFIILHATFITAVYKLSGNHFGAQFLERFVHEFTIHYDKEPKVQQMSKETTNLISLLSNLYSFGMITNNIVYDYLQPLTESLTDVNVELLLRVIKSCGAQLRTDNPSALKEIVLRVQKTFAELDQAKTPIRTKFMVETIMDLKNNKIKNLGSALTTGHIVRMKKLLGSHGLKITDPLSIGLKDLQKADKKGKWWLIGASWRVEEPSEQEHNYDGKDNEEFEENPTNQVETLLDGELSTSELYDLAKRHRMNTEIRRSIFITIMSSSDPKDAFLRLRRLRLNKKQQYEISRILLYCCGSEASYNPYYRMVAEQMCLEHKFRMSFQFALWRFFQRLGEASSVHNEEDTEFFDHKDSKQVELREIVSIAKLYGELTGTLSLPITVLKTLDMLHLQPKTVAFMEVFFISVFQNLDKHIKLFENREKQLVNILSKAREFPMLITGMHHLISSVVKQSDLVEASDERKLQKARRSLKKYCNLSRGILAILK